jgi:hypothetical protein
MPDLIGVANHGSNVPKKTATPRNKTSEFRPYDSGEHMAQWLQEAARRTRRPSSADLEPGTPAAVVQSPSPQSQTPQSPTPQSSIRSALERAKWPFFAALVAIAYLQYFYADVMLQIASLPAMIFFILINGQMPPV